LCVADSTKRARGRSACRDAADRGSSNPVEEVGPYHQQPRPGQRDRLCGRTCVATSITLSVCRAGPVGSGVLASSLLGFAGNCQRFHRCRGEIDVVPAVNHVANKRHVVRKHQVFAVNTRKAPNCLSNSRLRQGPPQSSLQRNLQISRLQYLMQLIACSRRVLGSSATRGAGNPRRLRPRGRIAGIVGGVARS
jgi:hypothetical protein